MDLVFITRTVFMLLIAMMQQVCPLDHDEEGIMEVDIALEGSYIEDAYFAKAQLMRDAWINYSSHADIGDDYRHCPKALLRYTWVC